MNTRTKTISDRPDRRQVRSRLRKALRARPEILFAYLHGPFLILRLRYNDMDVGIYLEPSTAENLDAFQYEMELSTQLTLDPGLKIDIRVLNRAPDGFAHSVLQGELLFTRDEIFTCDYVARIAQEYCDFEYHIRESTRTLLR